MDELDGVVGILTGTRPSICDELHAWLDTLPPPPAVERVRQPGNQIAWQRNQVVKRMYEMDKPWVLFVDADCVPPRGALEALLATGRALISGVVLERVEPFEVCAVRSFEPHERWTVADVVARPEPFAVPSVGTGCLLVRRQVFDRVPAPWFRCGQVNPEVLSEDLDFCLRAAAAGFLPHLHPRVLVGHRTDVILWPGRDGDVLAQWSDAEGRVPARAPLSDTVRHRLIHAGCEWLHRQHTEAASP